MGAKPAGKKVPLTLPRNIISLNPQPVSPRIKRDQ
jgi:hypothetical protein